MANKGGKEDGGNVHYTGGAKDIFTSYKSREHIYKSNV